MKRMKKKSEIQRETESSHIRPLTRSTSCFMQCYSRIPWRHS